MAWLTALRTLLSLALAIASIVRSRQLMAAGEAKATARSLAVIAERLGIADKLRAEVEALSDSELDAELRGDR